MESDSNVWEALAGAATALLGGERANSQSIDSSRENRAWMEEMSNTAHQREVVDLRKAGLNPILSAGGSGASTGNPAQPNITDTLTPALSSAIQVMQTTKDLEAKESQIKNVDQDTRNKQLTDALIVNQTAASAKDIEAKQLSNDLLKATMRSNIRKAEKDSRTDPENTVRGYINSIMSGPKDLLRKFKEENKEFKREYPSLP